ncbi:CD72 protein, partial [Turnix velox]|nr:CD72 protein [Turnix velox]
MAQSVIYADLKFATSPQLPCPTDPDEDDSPYENVQLGPGDGCGCSSVADHWPRHWRIPAGLLAAILVLLVATVALGTCYWQVTRSLQDTSLEHEAERDRLSQEIRAQEQNLEQTRLELAWARAELQRAWREGNSSHLDLRNTRQELGDTKQELTALRREMQEVQEKLNTTQSIMTSLLACLNTDCCPDGWVLYKSRCLFLSFEKKSCYDSLSYCKSEEAQLLAPNAWPLDVWQLGQVSVQSVG